MEQRNGLARLGVAGIGLAAVAVAGGLLVPGEVGALLRGYGAMLIPAVAWLFAGLALRTALVTRRMRPATDRVAFRRSAEDRRLRS